MQISRRQRGRQWLFLIPLWVGCISAPLAASAQEPPVTPPPTAPPPTAPPPTAAPTTAAPTTQAPETTDPPASTTAKPGPTTTRPPKATTTTVPPSTTTPEQLPTLPPLPDGQVPGGTQTTAAVVSDGGSAKVSPLFPALSIGGFTVALLVLVLSYLLNGRRVA